MEIELYLELFLGNRIGESHLIFILVFLTLLNKCAESCAQIIVLTRKMH